MTAAMIITKVSMIGLESRQRGRGKETNDYDVGSYDLTASTMAIK